MSLDDMYAAISQHNVFPNLNEIARIHAMLPMIDINDAELREEVC